MAQWRKTFFSLGGPENIADPAAEEALRFGQLLMAKRQQQQALGMERERLGFDQQRHADALRAAGEERLFERQKDRRNFGASREDALFQRGFATSGRDRQAMEADRDYQQRVADMQARREAEAAARAIQERTIGGQEQERLMRRESEQDARAREERYRQEERAAKYLDQREAQNVREAEQKAAREERMGERQEAAAARSLDLAEARGERADLQRRQAEAVGEQRKEVAGATKKEVDMRSAAAGILAGRIAREKLLGLTDDPFTDPYVRQGGVTRNLSGDRVGPEDFQAMAREPGYVFGPGKKHVELKRTLVDALRGPPDRPVATIEELEAVKAAVIAALEARVNEVLRENPGDPEPVGAYLDLREAVEREAAMLARQVVATPVPKPYQPKPANPVPRR